MYYDTFWYLNPSFYASKSYTGVFHKSTQLSFTRDVRPNLGRFDNKNKLICHQKLCGLKIELFDVE